MSLADNAPYGFAAITESSELLECLDCSAVVADWLHHRVWHDQQEKVND